jgi:hypothetical protein
MTDLSMTRKAGRRNNGIPDDLTTLPVMPEDHRSRAYLSHADGLEPGWYRNMTPTVLWRVGADGTSQRVRVAWKWRRATVPEPVAAPSVPVADATATDQADAPQHPVADATAALREWAAVYRQRDRVVRDAAAAGVGVNEIARETGLAKTTVIRVLRR